MGYTILQLMPADGWRALLVTEYCDGKGNYEPILEDCPLAAWALVSRDGVTGVEGVQAEQALVWGPTLEPGEGLGTFVAYLPAGADVEEYREAALDQLEEAKLRRAENEMLPPHLY